MHKVLLIGLDGATWRVLKPLMAIGKMPNLKRLCEEGSRGILFSTIPPLTPPAFASFLTGVNPAKHGIIDFQQIDVNTGEIKIVNANSLPYKTILEIVSENKKTVVSINVPLTYPPAKVNGVIIGGFLSPKEDKSFVYPKKIYNLLSQCNYKIVGMSPKKKAYLPIENIIDDLISVETIRFKVAKKLINEFPWDVFIVHNYSLDTVQHAFFHLLDENAFKEEFLKIAKFYEKTDNLIGELLEKIDPKETTVILFSDHGFKPVKKVVSLNSFLYQKGYLFPKISTKMRFVKMLKLGKIKRFIERADKKDLRYKLYSLLRMDKEARKKAVVRFTSGNIDFSKSTAFAKDGCFWGNVYLKGNLRAIERDFEYLKDNGKKVVKNIFYPARLYRGNFLEKLPQLVLEPEEDYSFVPGSPYQELFHEIDPQKENTGIHDLEGILIMWGNKVKQGVHLKCQILDLPPTILALVGLAIPAYMDGRVIEEAFSERLAIKKKEKFEAIKRITDFSSTEQEIIEQRLKDLGYF